VRQEVSRLLKKPHILARLEALRAEATKEAKYDLQRAMTRIEKAYSIAEKIAQPAAMVAAVKLETQLTGLLVERRENTNKTIKDASPEELEEETLRAAQAVIDKAKAKT
jgi:hypothetical protein